ncbi:MAG TPA: EF-hand domain-containing protein [Hyphomonadaceae bacterium]|nr:EF-hand domain-containing protein [Hyphomonadaceae bacterium]
MTTERPQKDKSPDKLRKEKKSETLEVRIPYDTKQAFLTACREDGTTASEVVRESVQTYLDERERPSQPEERSLTMNNILKLPEPVRRYGWRAAVGGAAAIGFVGLAALPSAAAPDFLSMFKKLDVNGDGVLSPDEFAGPKDDKGGDKNVVIETRSHITTSDSKDGKAPAPAAKSEVKQDAYAFYLPEGVIPDAAKNEQHEYRIISQHITKNSTSGDSSAAPPQPPQQITISVDDIRKEEFAQYDTDHDGKISLAEYQARQRAMLTRGFDILDTNHDKFLSQAEYAKILNPPVVKLDKDDKDSNERQITISGGPKVSPDALKAAFAKQDTNKDGKLSLQEYLPPS